MDEKRKIRDSYSLRVAVITSVVLVFLLIVLVRLAAIQLFDSENLQGYADLQGMRTEDILPDRGLILDHNGNILANNIIEFSIGARLVDLTRPENAFQALAQAFDKTSAYYREQFKRPSAFYILETGVRPEIVEQLQSDRSCHGLKYDKKMSRIYPYQEAAGQLIGFLWDDGTGQSGIEQYYETILQGEKGYQLIQRDKRGDIITYENIRTKAAVRGGNVRLTLDIEYQVILEEELAEAVKKSKSNGGMGIIMDPHSGEILAIANYPSFNPNHVRNSTPEIRRNRVIADQFEPGSIFKFVPVSAALDNNIYTPTSQIFCENGRWKVMDREISDTKPHEWLSVEEVLTHSSNIGAGKIAYQVGNRALYETARKFGFGEATAVGLWGEASGSLRTPDKWSGVAFSQIAMGHGVSATLIQMAGAYCAIANGGVLLKPHIVSATYNAKDKIVYNFSPSPVRRVMREETSAILKQMLEEVVGSGTGIRANIEGYHVAGKTGTAQKVVDGKYSNSKYYASFVGFFPSNNPVMVCAIVLDEPAIGLHHGGTSAAPAVKNVFSRIINTPDFHNIYKALPKPVQVPAPIAEKIPVSAGPALSILHSNARSAPAEPEIKVQTQKQDPPGKADEYYDIIMPDVRGMPVRSARQTLTLIGLQVESDASRGKVTHQEPEPGTHLKEGAFCLLEVRS
jgi:cell division protein FtsI (penicillin-binding protein 3)